MCGTPDILCKLELINTFNKATPQNLENSDIFYIFFHELDFLIIFHEVIFSFSKMSYSSPFLRHSLSFPFLGSLVSLEALLYPPPITLNKGGGRGNYSQNIAIHIRVV